MPRSNIYFKSDASPYSQMLRAGLRNVEDGLLKLNQVRKSIQHMLDGDGSAEAHFTEVTRRYGFESDAVAKAAFDELNSLLGKLNSDTPVDRVNAALTQAFAKMR